MTPNDMARLPPLDPEIRRPKWAEFLWRHGYSAAEVAPILQRSHEYVRQLGLPWEHPQRAEPTDDEIAFIAAWSRGEVTRADWERPAVLEAAA